MQSVLDGTVSLRPSRPFTGAVDRGLELFLFTRDMVLGSCMIPCARGPGLLGDLCAVSRLECRLHADLLCMSCGDGSKVGAGLQGRCIEHVHIGLGTGGLAWGYLAGWAVE